MGWATVWIRDISEGWVGYRGQGRAACLWGKLREEEALGKGLGVSKGVAERPDGIQDRLQAGLGTKGSRTLKEIFSSYFGEWPGARSC